MPRLQDYPARDADTQVGRRLPDGAIGHNPYMFENTRKDTLVWRGIAMLSGTVAAAAVRRVAVTTWRSTQHADPPENPAAHDVGWRDALIWTSAVAVGAAVARVVAQRGAAAAWQRATGEPPPIQTAS